MAIVFPSEALCGIFTLSENRPGKVAGAGNGGKMAAFSLEYRLWDV